MPQRKYEETKSHCSSIQWRGFIRSLSLDSRGSILWRGMRGILTRTPQTRTWHPTNVICLQTSLRTKTHDKDQKKKEKRKKPEIIAQNKSYILPTLDETGVGFTSWIPMCTTLGEDHAGRRERGWGTRVSTAGRRSTTSTLHTKAPTSHNATFVSVIKMARKQSQGQAGHKVRQASGGHDELRKQLANFCSQHKLREERNGGRKRMQVDMVVRLTVASGDLLVWFGKQLFEQSRSVDLQILWQSLQKALRLSQLQGVVFVPFQLSNSPVPPACLPQETLASSAFPPLKTLGNLQNGSLFAPC